MRLVSLLPAGTEIACALGLEDELVGVTEECDFPPSARGKPVVVRTTLPQGLGSGAIDAEVRAAKREGRTLYRLDLEKIRELGPDLLVTQALCDVCAASRPELEAILRVLPARPRVVTLTGTTLPGVLGDIVALGEATGRRKEAEALVVELWERVRAVEEAVRGAPRPRVACLEWLEPAMPGGHWVPDMVERAGAHDALAEPGQHSRAVPWHEVAAAEPEVLALAPCGFGLERTLREAGAVLARPELQATPALRSGRVLAFDGSAHFSRPGPRLVDGLEVLASALHPGRARPRFPWAWAPVEAPSPRR